MVYVFVAVLASLYLNIVGFKTVGWVLAFLIVIISLVVIYQEKILYIPVIQGWKTPADNPSGYQSPSQQRLKYEDVYFHTSDGTISSSLYIIERVSSTITPPSPFL